MFRALGFRASRRLCDSRNSLPTLLRNLVTDRLQYGTPAKVFHWLIVARLRVQDSICWLMPDIHGGMKPGDAMIFHVSIGTTILVLIVLRFTWRLTHPVAPESSLPPS